MEKKLVTKKTLKQAKYLSGANPTESILFLSNHDLLKFIKEEYLEDREYVIEKFESIKHQDVANPLYTLYDSKGFLGYAMHYYERYKTFDNFLTDNSITFEERKKISIRLCKLFEYFEKNKFAYDDIHPLNILYLDDDIKLVDIDSGLFYSRKDSLEYDARIRTEQTRLAKLCLSSFYGIHPFVFDNYFKEYKKTLLDMLPSNIKDIYKYAFENSYSHFSCGESIDQITQDTISETKLLLKKTSL